MVVKRRKRLNPKKVAMIGYLAVITFLVIVPVAYAVIGAFRGAPAHTLWEQFFPSSWTLENFGEALNRVPLGRQMINSVLVTVAQTTLQVTTAVLAAMALVFGRLKRPGLVFAFIMFTMMIPSEAVIVARFLLINDMGLFDTIIAVFLPFAAMAFPIFLMRQAFLSFPVEIYEAAQLDGVSPLRFLWSFLLPITRPQLLAVVLTSAISAWNGYLWPLLVTQTSASRTVQVGIAQLSDAESTNVGVILAGLTFITIPMVALVVLGQKFLTRGLTEGSSK